MFLPHTEKLKGGSQNRLNKSKKGVKTARHHDIKYRKSQTMKRTRRQFLRSTAAATTTFSATFAAAFMAAPAIISRTALAKDGAVGANDRIIIGFVGVGGRARGLMEHIPRSRGRIVAVADFWSDKIADCLREKRESGLMTDEKPWNVYSSDAEMFDREKLDCAFIATQDFCRTLPCCRAVLAGLDVYAEKPLTAYIAEGRRLADLVQKTKRVFQVGTQQRSMRLNKFGCRLIRDGALGRVKAVEACNYPGPEQIPSDLAAEPVPAGLDWDAWQGPTAYRAFNAQLLGWMRWWDYSGGEMTNWGAHGLDQVQSALGASHSGPLAVSPHPDGEGKVVLHYPNDVQVRLVLPMNKGPVGGAIFRCQKGNLEINRNNLKANPPELIAAAPEADPPEGPTWIARPHIENFFDCMATRETPRADVETGHRSATVCHLANICRQLNRPLRWNPEKEEFIDDPEANAAVNRPRRKGYELPS